MKKHNNIEILETTNTIFDFYDYAEKGIYYEGLKETSDQAVEYVVRQFQAQKSFSEIIESMPQNLGYTLHPDSFLCSLNVIISKVTPDKQENIIKHFKYMDDLDLINKESAQLDITPNFRLHYTLFELNNNSSTLGFKPKFTLLSSTPEVVPVPTEPSIDPHQAKVSNPSPRVDPSAVEGDYIILQPTEPQPGHWYPHGMSIEFDDHTKHIILYTVLAFIAIRTVAYYCKEENDNKPAQGIDDDASFYSGYEAHYIILYILIIDIIPISILILYKLRFYYYYKLKRWLGVFKL